MITEPFAKPGDKNVISPDYEREIKVQGKTLFVQLAMGCWQGGPLRVYVGSKDNVAGGEFSTRKDFDKATFSDLEKLLKKIKLTRCSVAGCKGHYMNCDPFFAPNPKLCAVHIKKDRDKVIAEIENKMAAKQKRKDDAAVKKGFRYRGVVWIHPKHGSDYCLMEYYKKKPTKPFLKAIAVKRRSQITNDFMAVKLDDK